MARKKKAEAAEPEEQDVTEAGESAEQEEGVQVAASAPESGEPEAGDQQSNGPAAEPIRGPKTITRPLLCKLSDAEMKDLGVEMGKAEVQIEELKEQVGELNGRKRKLEGYRNEIGHKLETGEEVREIQCYVLEDFAQKCVRIVRADTGDVVEERAMTAAELQRELGFSGAGPKLDETEADPPPDSSLRTMADEQAESSEDEDGDLTDEDLGDDFDMDDEDGEQLNA